MNAETKLKVSSTGPERQFIVTIPEEIRCPPEVEWNDYYVSFSGYFGKHGPHVFAAAPDLFEALSGIQWKSADRDNMEFTARITYVQMDALRAALLKAGG